MIRRDYGTSSSFTWRQASAVDYAVVISIKLVTSGTPIPRGDASNSWYMWSTAGPSGIVERFCAAGKPPQLWSHFRKWAADGYRQ